MYLKYGTYRFADNSVTVKEHITPHLNAAGIPLTYTMRLSVTGDLLVQLGLTTSAEMQRDLAIQQAALRAALSNPYQDLIWYGDDNAPLATAITNRGSLTGVRLIDGPNFEGEKATAEYVARRAFSFTMAADYYWPRLLSVLESFTESIAYAGGLPIRSMVRSVNKPPIDQVIYPFTEFEAEVSGHAVGLKDWPFGGPNKGPPLRFPANMLREAPRISPTSPERVGPTTYKNFGVKWSYRVASPTPLIAAPTLWTN